MDKLFLKLVSIIFISGFVSAYENQDVVYGLVDYKAEIGVPPPWNSFEQYHETLDNATIGPVNEYVSAVSIFIKKRCQIEYCKHMLIVGDDFVIPLWRDLRGSNIVFSDSVYVSTGKSGSRSNLLPKINSSGAFDSDGDGWSDEEEAMMNTDANNSSDNFCTKLPSIGKVLDGTLEPQYWVDLFKRTAFGNCAANAQKCAFLPKKQCLKIVGVLIF